MLYGPMTEEQVTQILKDAGCPAEFIGEYRLAMEAKDVPRRLRLLGMYRCGMLERVHVEQKRLDCLDYLRYRLEKQMKEGRAEK